MSRSLPELQEASSDREWRLLKSICKRVLARPQLLSSVERWYHKEAITPQRQSFSFVLSGIFAAKRQPVSREHPLYLECREDVNLFAQSVLKEAYWPAAVAWLCRNRELREAFVSVCATIRSSTLAYTSNYAASFESPPPSFSKPRLMAPAQTSSVLLPGGWRPSPGRNKPLAASVPLSSTAKYASRGPAIEAPEVDLGAIKRKLRARQARDPQTETGPKTERVPWSTFQYSVNSMRSEHQASFGKVRVYDATAGGKRRQVAVSHAPTAPLGYSMSALDEARVAAELQSLRESSPPLDLTKPPQRSEAPRPVMARREVDMLQGVALGSPAAVRSPLPPQTERRIPWDITVEEGYNQDTMCSTYHRFIDRCALDRTSNQKHQLPLLSKSGPKK
eukprot:RCo045943